MTTTNIKRVATIETRYGSFQCVFEPEKDMGGYVVEARGVPGALSWGKNFTEAKRMIREAIEGAIEAGIVARGEKCGVLQVRSDRHAVPVV